MTTTTKQNGGGADKADSLWSSIQPSPSKEGGTDLDDLERIMWGTDGLPPPSSSEEDIIGGEGIKSLSSSLDHTPTGFATATGDKDSASSKHEEQPTTKTTVADRPPAVGEADTSEANNNEFAADGATGVGDGDGGVTLSCIVWKKRSGLGAYSQGYVRKAWERRRLVVVGTKVLYYSTFEEETVEDNIKLRPRAILDLVDERCTVEVIDPATDGAPSPFEVDIVSEDKETRWKFCFDAPESLMDLLEVVQSILSEAGIGGPHQDDPESFEHNFEAGDHIYRWEMIIFPPVIYPIQIHGIVLEAGKNCVIVADFGMTGYGKKEGSSFKHADDGDDHDLQDNLQAAWRKFRPNEDQRLNIVTMTDPKEIHKWFKASYGAGGILSHKKKSKKRMMGKLSSSFFKASPDSEHLERRALSASVRARANTAEGTNNIVTDSPRNKPKSAKRNSSVPDVGQSSGTGTTDTGSIDSDVKVPGWFDTNGTSVSEHEPSVFSIAKKDHHADSDLPKSDPREIVLARANFLLEHGEEVLPPYHVFYSNSECIAGTFCWLCCPPCMLRIAIDTSMLTFFLLSLICSHSFSLV